MKKGSLEKCVFWKTDAMNTAESSKKTHTEQWRKSSENQIYDERTEGIDSEGTGFNTRNSLTIDKGGVVLRMSGGILKE